MYYDKNESSICFNINQVAKQIEVSPATIRNWETAGLFFAKRKENNYRVFNLEDIELLQKIKKYSIEQGMKLSVIKNMLNSDGLTKVKKIQSHPENSFSSKVRAYRKKNKYTLKELSNATQISLSYLNHIELGQVSPSLDILKKIAKFYGESVITFLEMGSKKNEVVTRKEDIELSATHLEGVFISMLGGENNTIFSPIFYKVLPNAGDFTAHSHQSGHEFIYVLSGEVLFTLDSEPFIVKANDSIQFESTRIHKWHNSGKENATFLWTHTSL